MAKIIFGMHQSLDGFVNHEGFKPGPKLFRHFIDQVRDVAGLVYGRHLYEIMRYWEDDQAGWGADEREFAAVWRNQKIWVVSRTLKSVGPNATLVEGDVVASLRELKARLSGEIRIGGTELAQSLVGLGIIDEYQLYIRPFVLGRGKPFFAGPAPSLRLAANDRIGEDAVRLSYVPA